MCFSAVVSFTSAAILVPAGLFTFKETLRLNKYYWAFALLPVGFGIQQVFEGGVWWALEANNADILELSSLGFLFFSHFFWIIWIPFSSYLVEKEKSRRTLFLLITVMGVICGTMMYLSLLNHPNWVAVSVINHSIHYETNHIYNNFLPLYISSTVYILMILLPLMASSNKHIRILGAIVLLSMVVTGYFYEFTFISVWCYLAALNSMYIYYIVIKQAKYSERYLVAEKKL